MIRKLRLLGYIVQPSTNPAWTNAIFDPVTCQLKSTSLLYALSRARFACDQEKSFAHVLPLGLMVPAMQNRTSMCSSGWSQPSQTIEFVFSPQSRKNSPPFVAENPCLRPVLCQIRHTIWKYKLLKVSALLTFQPLNFTKHFWILRKRSVRVQFDWPAAFGRKTLNYLPAISPSSWTG